MKTNVFLDCGGHYGEGLREFIEMYKINNEWIVETFEPNPECRYNEKISDVKLSNLILHNKAVWIFDGNINFSVENLEIWHDNDESVITELNSTHLTRTKKPILVECVDFHKILLKYPKDEFNVIVKLDIEGAEYRVLRHVIASGSAINITKLFVEWHHVDLTNENQDTTNNLINTLTMIGVNVNNWK